MNPSNSNVVLCHVQRKYVALDCVLGLVLGLVLGPVFGLVLGLVLFALVNYPVIDHSFFT